MTEINENVSMEDVNLEVVESEQKPCILDSMSTGEKVASGGVLLLAGYGAFHLGKKGLKAVANTKPVKAVTGKITGLFSKKKHAEVTTEVVADSNSNQQ